MTTSILMNNDWAKRSLCKSLVDRDLMTQAEVYQLFFPTRKSNANATASAKRMCERFCPVKSQCAAEGLAINDKFGVRGGKTANDRRRIRSRSPVALRSSLPPIDEFLDFG